MRVALKFAFFSANNEAELGMNFEAGKTVHNVHTVAFHFFSPVNVLLFVEPSLSSTTAVTCCRGDELQEEP